METTTEMHRAVREFETKNGFGTIARTLVEGQDGDEVQIVNGQIIFRRTPEHERAFQATLQEAMKELDEVKTVVESGLPTSDGKGKTETPQSTPEGDVFARFGLQPAKSYLKPTLMDEAPKDATVVPGMHAKLMGEALDLPDDIHRKLAAAL